MSLHYAQSGVLYVHNLRPIFIFEVAEYIAFMLNLYKFIMHFDLHNLTHNDGTKN